MKQNPLMELVFTENDKVQLFDSGIPKRITEGRNTDFTVVDAYIEAMKSKEGLDVLREESKQCLQSDNTNLETGLSIRLRWHDVAVWLALYELADEDFSKMEKDDERIIMTILKVGNELDRKRFRSGMGLLYAK